MKDNHTPALQDVATGHTVMDKVAFAVCGRIISKFFFVGNVDLCFLDLPPMPAGNGEGEKFVMRFHSRNALRRLFYKPSMNIGEIFMEGGWTLDQGDLGRFMGLLLTNEELLEETAFFKAFDAASSSIGHWLTVNSVERSHENVQHHYDLGNDLYEAFLDDEMLYSCAFFDGDITELADAQLNKLEVTISRLNLEEGMKVLDIGCGWGAMARALGRHGGDVTGITLSKEQLAYAIDKIPPEHKDRIDLRLQDYRIHAQENQGVYDRIVSIGMFEHVGRRHYEEFFEAVKMLLKPGGRAVIHSIVKDTTTRTNPWLRKYIFPGGQAPRIMDMTGAAEAVGLTVPCTPFEHEGRHYAETLRQWRARFDQAWPTLNHSRYDERFRCMWHYYLCGSEASFDALSTRVAQVVVEKPV